jgi:hypothetical protein
MNVTRLVGIGLEAVGAIVLFIAYSGAYPLGLYLGIVVVAVGLVIYEVDVLKGNKKQE